MSLAELKSDAAAHRARIANLKLEDLSGDKLAKVVRLELCENILPLFEGLLDAIEEEVVAQIDELDQAVDELIDQSEDVLHPETTQQIAGVLELGGLLANEVEFMVKKVIDLGAGDQVDRKRIAGLIAAYRQAAPAVMALLASITLDDPVTEVPGNGADEQDGDEQDGDEQDGGEDDGGEDDALDDEDAVDDDDEDDEVPHG